MVVSDDHLVLSYESGIDGGSKERGGHDGAGNTGTSDGGEVAALRALACAAWIHPEWTGIRTSDAAAERTVAALGLGRFAGWPVSAASKA